MQDRERHSLQAALRYWHYPSRKIRVPAGHVPADRFSESNSEVGGDPRLSVSSFGHRSLSVGAHGFLLLRICEVRAGRGKSG